jgi:hypothetical protein
MEEWCQANPVPRAAQGQESFFARIFEQNTPVARLILA